jgi:hypothetical protein
MVGVALRYCSQYDEAAWISRADSPAATIGRLVLRAYTGIIVKREIIIRLRGNDSASRPGPFKRRIMAAAVIAIALTILMAILLLGLSLILIIWGMIAITLLTAIVKAILRDDSMKRL